MQDVQCVLPIGYMMRERYVVEDLLGKGGFGAVYLVRDVRENLKPFALKEVIGAKRKEGRRFTSQTALLRHLDHPALPRVHEVFSGDKRDRLYILVDYIEGPNLEGVRQLQPEKRFSLPQVMTLMAPIVHALSYLHSQRPPLIHRDLKPSNIILPEASNGTMLVDFGIAGAYDSGTITGAVRRGAPGYRAPAQYDGGSAPHTDIYSLGAILYLLLTGTVPSDAFDRLTKLGDKELDPLLPVDRVVPTVPTTVARAIHRALSLNSDDCFSTVEEFWDALWQLSVANQLMQLARKPEVAAPTNGHTELAANQAVQQLVGPAAATSTEEGPNSISNPMMQRASEDSGATPGPADTPAIFEGVTGPVAAPVQERPPVHTPTLEIGQVFDRYRIIRWLGSGIAGESYEAEDSLLLRKVTLKLIHPQSALPDSARQQFFREMQGVSVLDHPYLAPVLDFGEINDRLYVARRYVSSGSLLGTEGRLWFRPPLTVWDAIHYGHQLAQALQYMHHSGYIHGALTLSNILVLRGPDPGDEAGYAPFLLADVGLTNFVRRFGLQQHAPFPFTAAPEQLGKRVTPAGDQFALAALLYFWLAGRPPYLGTPEEIERLKLTETITPLSSLNTKVSTEQDGVLLRALSVSPEDRYPSVLALADALQGTLAPEAQPVPNAEPMARPEFITPVETLPVEVTGAECIAESGSSLETQLAPSVESEMEPASQMQLATFGETERPSALESEPLSEFGTIPQTGPLDFVKAEPLIRAENATEPGLASTAEPITVLDGKPTLEREPGGPQLTPVSAPQPPIPDTTDRHQPASEPLPQTMPDIPLPLPEPFPPEPEPAAAASTEEGPTSIANPLAQQAAEPEVAAPTDEHTELGANPTVQLGMEPVVSTEEGPAQTPATFEEVTRPVPVQGRPSVHSPRKPGLQVLFLLVLFVTLFAGLGTGIGLWFYTAGHRSPASALPATAQPSTAPSPAAPGAEVTATATHPTTPSNLASSYVGTIYDIAGSISAKMSLTAIQQNQGNISGDFTGLQRTGTFNGIFDPSKHIQFTVKDSAGHLMLSFNGDMQSGGELSGDYCSVDQNARCTGDYGLWSVTPES